MDFLEEVDDFADRLENISNSREVLFFVLLPATGFLGD
jgi:hypothetical protein